MENAVSPRELGHTSGTAPILVDLLVESIQGAKLLSRILVVDAMHVMRPVRGHVLHSADSRLGNRDLLLFVAHNTSGANIGCCKDATSVHTFPRTRSVGDPKHDGSMLSNLPVSINGSWSSSCRQDLPSRTDNRHTSEQNLLLTLAE